MGMGTRPHPVGPAKSKIVSDEGFVVVRWRVCSFVIYENVHCVY